MIKNMCNDAAHSPDYAYYVDVLAANDPRRVNHVSSAAVHEACSVLAWALECPAYQENDSDARRQTRDHVSALLRGQPSHVQEYLDEHIRPAPSRGRRYYW